MDVMHLGITSMLTDLTMTPAELARATEDRGFESLWLPEHSHIPTSRESPWPGSKPGSEEPLPYYYSRYLDHPEYRADSCRDSLHWRRNRRYHPLRNVSSPEACQAISLLIWSGAE